MKVRKLATILGSVACVGAVTFSYADNIEINNPGFEDKWSGWMDVDPSAISSDSYAGRYSAKVTGLGAGFSQTVTVHENTRYRLTAQIDGRGRIGVSFGHQDISDAINSDGWETASVEFNSGSHNKVTIFGQYDGDEARFDAFELFTVGDSDLPGTGNCNNAQALTIVNASDDGTNDGHGPRNTIDGSLSAESRWSSYGSSKWIEYDLGHEVMVTDLDVAFYRGDQRSAYFDIETSLDGLQWTAVYPNGHSAGNHTGFERFDVVDSQARFVRIIGNGTNASAWNSYLEVKVLGCSNGDVPLTEPPITDLDPALPPSGNFELLDWYLSVPTDTDNSGTADSIKESQLVSGYQDNEYFYTAADGGMVFVCPVQGYKTSKNTSYTRTELREMLRRGDTSISTQGVNENNWVFGSTSASAQADAGGVNGTLTATLAVNHVTTTGLDSQVGRVIIGQIHANDDEPLRLYYRKLPGNRLGSVYFAHEPLTGSEQWIEMIGSRDDDAPNPSDGIALNEVFSYRVDVVDDLLTVTLARDGKPDVIRSVDMSQSGYDSSSQYMYFKAGVYNQNNSGDADDYVQATFYALDNKHEGYDY